MIVASILLAAAMSTQRTVNIDVKDEDVRVVLKSLQKQCGIKNLILDKDVQGKATFMFHDLPCRAAFNTVFRTMGLRSTSEGASLIAVAPRNK